MIIGNPSVFAIESGISEAYERLSLLALGFFLIHVRGRTYGVRSPNATLLACSVDAVRKRIAERGAHVAPFASEPDAGELADSFREALYADDLRGNSFFGIAREEFSEFIYSRNLRWAPDGDEAFDDGSYVLQFDVQDQARLIAFRSSEGYVHDATSLCDLWLPSEEFYSILQRWYDAFMAEWSAFPKSSYRS